MPSDLHHRLLWFHIQHVSYRNFVLTPSVVTFSVPQGSKLEVIFCDILVFMVDMKFYKIQSIKDLVPLKS